MLPACCRQLQASDLCSPDAEAARSPFRDRFVRFAVQGFRLIALLLWRENGWWTLSTFKGS